jgi:diaminopimelate epimerase
MRIFNADGSEPEMCGNGIRCLARFLADTDGDSAGRGWRVETLAGTIVPELQADGRIRVDMGPPFLRPEEIPTTLPPAGGGPPEGTFVALDQTFQGAAVGMGNPHLVIPVPDVSAIALEALGPLLEVHPAFPARTNVHFVEIRSPSHLVMRVWERGAGPTLACGTGACATLVACHGLNLCGRSARVDLPGGSLEIQWDPSTDHVFMTGPAEQVFDGVLVPGFAGLRGPDGQIGDRGPDGGTAMTMADERLSDASTAPESSGPEPIDCAVACVNGCQRPDNCSSAEARARVETLLQGRSLDDLVALATQSLESRTRSRLQRDGERDR